MLERWRARGRVGERRGVRSFLANLRARHGTVAWDEAWEDEAEAEPLSSGSVALDRALGCGGFPRGRVVEIYGEDASGKTSLALLAVAACQAAGGAAAFIDAEHALDPGQVRRMGADPRALFVSQPDVGEQALEITEAFARSGAVDLVVVDSVAALVPRAELSSGLGATPRGLQAQLMSQSLRRLLGAVARSRCVLLFLNQMRARVDAAGEVFLGSPGGRALRHAASVRLELRRAGALRAQGRVVGTRTRIRVVKNRIAPPHGEAELVLHHHVGFDPIEEVLRLASREGLLDPALRSLRWEEARAALAGDPALQTRLQERLLGGLAARHEAQPHRLSRRSSEVPPSQSSEESSLPP